jgi:hypothetical protein
MNIAAVMGNIRNFLQPQIDDATTLLLSIPYKSPENRTAIKAIHA